MTDRIEVKRKGRASIGCKVNYVTLILDHTHDLEPKYLGQNFEIATVSQNLGGPVDMERTAYESWIWPWTLGVHGEVGGCTIW